MLLVEHVLIGNHQVLFDAGLQLVTLQIATSFILVKLTAVAIDRNEVKSGIAVH